MSIILNEREWVEGAIASRQLGNRPMETLSRIARYYHQHEGYGRQEVRDKLDDYLLQCDPRIVLVKWSDALDRISKNCGKHPLIEIDSVAITEDELKAIDALGSMQLGRLMFTLLCVAKYWNSVRPLKNNGWVNTVDKDIMRMANINTSIKRQSRLLYELREAGLISFSKRVDNLNIRVELVEPDSPVKLHVVDFRNLGNQYMLYLGESFLQCAECGLAVRKKSNSQKYCPDCAAELHIKRCVESVMRRRESDTRLAIRS